MQVLCAGLVVLGTLLVSARGASAEERRRTADIVLVHGLWAKPESLEILGHHLRHIGYRVFFIRYDMPKTCADFGQDIAAKLGDLIDANHLSRDHLYAYGYSLGGMGIALAGIPVRGLILDAPANYPETACHNLPDYFPGSANYPGAVLQWRHESANASPAVESLMRSRARILVIGHEMDDLVPQPTIEAYAHANKADIWWVPGNHQPDWSEVARIADSFITMQGKFVGDRLMAAGPPPPD
nr:hypothetical protein [uncultured Gellertiella sp.]